MKTHKHHFFTSRGSSASHSCSGSIRGKETLNGSFSPANWQVKLYSFTCQLAGEAVQLHLD